METSSVRLHHNVIDQVVMSLTGTFGQSIPWNLYDPATYQHPLAPLDVLTDPRSLPINQQTKQEQEQEEMQKHQTVAPVRTE